jgi:hypothetical protein
MQICFADIVINVESEVQGGMRDILQHLLEFFKAHPEYDVCTGLVEDYVYGGSGSATAAG